MYLTESRQAMVPLYFTMRGWKYRLQTCLMRSVDEMFMSYRLGPHFHEREKMTSSISKIPYCDRILDKHRIKMTNHHATFRCSQKSGESTKLAYKEIEHQNEIDTQEIVKNELAFCLDYLLLVMRKYFDKGKSFGNEPKEAIKHKIKLFKEGFVKKITVKDNVMSEKKTFLAKCLVSATMKNIRYQVYLHLCQVSGDMLMKNDLQS